MISKGAEEYYNIWTRPYVYRLDVKTTQVKS